MDKNMLEEARILYLRGFNGKYIKEHTGVSVQSLLKQLLSRNIKYTKEDIVDYQFEYISTNYTKDDIKEAYAIISEEHTDLYKASKGKHINMLNCGFGEYAKVFKRILGDDDYQELRDKYWAIKQKASVESKYGVSNVFDKRTFHQFVSDEAVADGRLKREATLLSKYGVAHPNQYSVFNEKMKAASKITNIRKYGVPFAMQNRDIAKTSAQNRQKSMLAKYGAANSVEIKEIRDKIFEARRRNNTMSTSRAEESLYLLLCDVFGFSDVQRNIVVDDRYPYHVDFYVKSLDLFIELNGDRSHGGKWFDPQSIDDISQLCDWQQNMLRVENETNKKSRYRQFIKVWTVLDVTKRQIASKHNLNYLVFWDGTTHQVDGEIVAKLSDAHSWVNDGCPLPQNWHKINTY